MTSTAGVHPPHVRLFVTPHFPLLKIPSFVFRVRFGSTLFGRLPHSPLYPFTTTDCPTFRSTDLCVGILVFGSALTTEPSITQTKTMVRNMNLPPISQSTIRRLVIRSNIKAMTCPPQRRRSRYALSLMEREEISRGLVARQSLRSIAQSLNLSPSTISREVRRNGGRQTYRAARSDQRAWDCAARPK